MTNTTERVPSLLSRFKLSRRGKKLSVTDDPKVLLALPKEVPERVWAEILQKEENDLLVLDIREEIIESTMNIVYEKYMEKQSVAFTVHCAAEAWLKLINWSFYKHDPGEDPASYPPCFIPKRKESWIPDDPPNPSPKDTWCKHDLNIVEDCSEQLLKRWPSSDSIDYPVVEEIPKECRFPGKIFWPTEMLYEDKELVTPRRPSAEGAWDYVEVASESVPTIDATLNAESEVLQKVTDYSNAQISKSSTMTTSKRLSSVDGSLHGAGDSVVEHRKSMIKSLNKRKSFNKSNMTCKSKGQLPMIDDSRSRLSIISDCRLRSLRVDTQYEISSEKIETPPLEPVRRK